MEVSKMTTKNQLTRQYCPNCNEELTAADFPFCSACAAEINFCPRCQRPLHIDADLCPCCGVNLAAGEL
jgi:Zn-finger nucleic acid-binding protein